MRAASAPPANQGNTMKALLVDDSRAMRMILARTLKEIGFEVTEAGHGLEGLEKLNANGPFDLALVDWNMPEMDGLTFVSTVRQGQLAQQMRIVMVTTESEAERVAAALAAGADEYVTKPFTKDALTSKLGIIGLLVD
jgi:two-component system chemotaxis response regulator CheY